MQSVEYPVAETAIIFRRKRSGRLVPWIFDPEIEKVDRVSASSWEMLFSGMTEAIIVDAQGRRWTASRPRLAGIQTKHYRGESLLSRVILLVLGLVVLNVSLQFKFGSMVQDRVTAEEFRRFVLDLLDHQKPGFTRAPEEDVRARILKRKTLRGMINAVMNP